MACALCCAFENSTTCSVGVRERLNNLLHVLVVRTEGVTRGSTYSRDFEWICIAVSE